MLRVKGLKKSWGKKNILKGIDLEVKASEIKVIMGLNGSGKSTLLKIIAGLIKADEGKIFLNNRDITELDPEERNVGYVPQQPALFPHLTVKENIYYSFKNKRGSREIADQLIEILELKPYLKKRAETLSGGYKSRVSLARALASKPDLVLLDEPLSNFDPAIKNKLFKKFKEVLGLFKIPVLYVTHDPDEGKAIGNSFSILTKGVLKDISSSEIDSQILNLKL